MSEFDPRAFFTDETAPPAPKHLGWKLLDFDMERGWVKIGFTPREEFLNGGGGVQGGFISAMLDDTVGPAALIKARKPLIVQTIDLHTHFLRPVPLGPITTEGVCNKLGRTVAFMEAKLFDAEGRLCARATSSGMISDWPEAPNA